MFVDLWLSGFVDCISLLGCILPRVLCLLGLQLWLVGFGVFSCLAFLLVFVVCG